MRKDLLYSGIAMTALGMMGLIIISFWSVNQISDSTRSWLSLLFLSLVPIGISVGIYGLVYETREEHRVRMDAYERAMYGDVAPACGRYVQEGTAPGSSDGGRDDLAIRIRDMPAERSPENSIWS